MARIRAKTGLEQTSRKQYPQIARFSAVDPSVKMHHKGQPCHSSTITVSPCHPDSPALPPMSHEGAFSEQGRQAVAPATSSPGARPSPYTEGERMASATAGYGNPPHKAGERMVPATAGAEPPSLLNTGHPPNADGKRAPSAKPHASTNSKLVWGLSASSSVFPLQANVKWAGTAGLSWMRRRMLPCVGACSLWPRVSGTSTRRRRGPGALRPPACLPARCEPLDRWRSGTRDPRAPRCRCSR